jgi:hypothetical protein
MDIEKCLPLSRGVLAQLRSLGAHRAVIHFGADTLGAQSGYWPMVHANDNGILTEQTDFEKQKQMVRLEITL